MGRCDLWVFVGGRTTNPDQTHRKTETKTVYVEETKLTENIVIANFYLDRIT